MKQSFLNLRTMLAACLPAALAVTGLPAAAQTAIAPVEQIVTLTVHLQRTSEADEVPAVWALGELQAKLAAMPAEQRATVMLQGWRGAKLTYPHRRSDLEVAQARAALLAQGLRLGLDRGGLSRDEMEALLKAAGL